MSKVLFTCGVGDFIAIETWLTPAEKEAVVVIYWATRARKTIQESINLKLIFPNLQEQISLYENWCSAEEWSDDIRSGKIYCIQSKSDVPTLGTNVGNDVIDYSIVKILERPETPYSNSAYLRNILADIGKFNLPEKYVCIHPYSSNAIAPFRDISAEEWNSVRKYLNNNNIQGVVIGTHSNKSTPIPFDQRLLNLTDRTSIAEALEITKKSSAFIGSSSVFSVLAAKALPEEKVFIKGHHTLKSSSYLSYKVMYKYRRPLGNFYYHPLPESMNRVYQDLSFLS